MLILIYFRNHFHCITQINDAWLNRFLYFLSLLIIYKYINHLIYSYTNWCRRVLYIMLIYDIILFAI